MISDSHPILVTGGTGLLGGSLVAALLQLQLPVRMTVRNHSRPPRPQPRLEVLHADLRQPETMTRAAQDCSAIVHLASAMRLSLWPMICEDLIGTLGLLKGMSAAPFIYASTISAATPPGRIFPETGYGLGKRLCESLVLGYGKRRGIPMVIRFPHLVGRGAWREGGLLDMVAGKIEEGDIVLPEEWNDEAKAPCIAWINLSDAVHAICNGLSHPKPGCYTVVGSLTPWPAFVGAVGKAMGKKDAVAYRAGAKAPPWMVDARRYLPRSA